MNKLTSCLTIILLIFPSISLAISEDELAEKIQALNWQYEPSTYTVKNGIASIQIQSGDFIALGEDAKSFMQISEGHNGFQPDAAVIRLDTNGQATQSIYTINDIGFLEMDDWNDHVNPTEMLREIRKNTQAANKARKPGYPNLFVDGWVEEPYLERQSSTVYWAIEGHSDNGLKFVNAKALKLGRHGYTEVIWMGERNQFISAVDSLSPSLTAYHYNDGLQYADYDPGKDKLAAIGVGALSYKLITGNKAAKAAGAGLVAILAAFAKKLWFLIFLPFIYLWNRVKSIFSDRKVDG